MKRIIPVFLLCAVLTGCVEYYDDEPEICTETTSEICEISQEITEICSEQTTSETAEFSEIQEITAFEELEFIEYEYEEEPEMPEILEISEEITTETTVFMTEETTEIPTESVTEFMTETETLPEISEAEPVSETETESESDKEPETEPEFSDLEKAQIIYEYMLENGHGTCVNYACQTYEKCLEIGLPCYIVWTDAGLYGHVANTVCVNEIWFVLDTQAGGFLESNYGFTEVVNLDCEHIADGEMLSDYSYQELFE